ncbi:MAG: cytochrome C', partial [Giesbergeria sp.]|nr:cytochrome C' [Giesbergeria sp.]
MKRTLITLAMTLAVAAPALADEALAKSKNCMACHAVDKKL